MKFVILGATGPTGIQLTEECLDLGYEVIALVRSPDKLQVKHERLTIQKVDIFNQNDLVPHMKGCDAVMSCLGSAAMFMSLDDPGLPWVVKWLLRPIFLRQILPDMGSMEDYLSESCQDLDFTVVRPAQLTHDKSSGQEVLAVEGQCVPDVAMKIARRDLARFMLKCVVSGGWKKKHVAVGVK